MEFKITEAEARAMAKFEGEFCKMFNNFTAINNENVLPLWLDFRGKLNKIDNNNVSPLKESIDSYFNQRRDSNLDR